MDNSEIFTDEDYTDDTMPDDTMPDDDILSNEPNHLDNLAMKHAKRQLESIFGRSKTPGPLVTTPLHLGYETYLRAFIAERREWICTQLNCGADDLVVIRTESMDSGVWGLKNTIENRDFRKELFPDGDIGIQSFSAHTTMLLDTDSIIGRECTKIESISAWRNPFVCTVPDTDVRFIFYALPYAEGPYADVDYTANVFVVSAASHQKLFSWMLENERKRTDKYRSDFKPFLKTFDSEQSSHKRDIPITSWSALTSSTSALQLKADVEAFRDNYKWYRRNGLAYRRGYLVYGPPGNGKTTCVKIIASQYRMNVYTANFGMKQVNDATLGAVYDAAKNDAPAIIQLEDIDRIFGKGTSASHTTNVTFQRLLNCLDGVDTPDGIIVIASANHPDELDASILRRPGRFHRLIGFNNPDPAERETFFAGRITTLSPEDAKVLAADTDRFSYAQLNEVYIQASMDKLQARSEVNPTVELSDLQHAVGVIRNSYQDLKDKRSDKAGFRS